MKGKTSKQTYAVFAIVLCAIMIILLFVLFFYYKHVSTDGNSVSRTGTHILVLIPDLSDHDLQKFKDGIRSVQDKFSLRIELQILTSVSAQKQMLSLVPASNIEAVLMWPISSIAGDYREELTACAKQDIPVILIGHDLEDNTLRNSYVGKGFDSDILVINQILFEKDRGKPIVIGSYSNSGEGNVYELLVMQREKNDAVESKMIQSEKLKKFVEHPPANYNVIEYIRIKDENNESLSLNLALVYALQELEDIELFFSLDDNLTAVLATSIESGALVKSKDFFVVGHGSLAEMKQYIELAIIDELVVSRIPYSAKIGLIYIKDILKHFWVPDSMDSGVELITRGNLERYTGGIA